MIESKKLRSAESRIQSEIGAEELPFSSYLEIGDIVNVLFVLEGTGILFCSLCYLIAE